MRAFAAFAAACLLAGAASAHPHAETDAQAALILAPDGIALRLTAVPGTDHGPAVAARIDTDGDGLVLPAEAEAAARAVLATATLAVDGAPVPLALTSAEADPADWLAAGMGCVRAEAAAAVDLAGSQTVTLRIGHDGYGAGWFVQPYYAEGLVKTVGAPAVDRAEGAMTLTFGD